MRTALAPSAPSPARAARAGRGVAVAGGLEAWHFARIASGGFGDGLNSYAHSMAWFQDRLYVGTTRGNLCMLKLTGPPPHHCWPVNCPDDLYQLDRRAEIWCYDPREEAWERVFKSPLVTGVEGREVERDIGYRGMAVFQAPGDREPCLYVNTWAPSKSGRPAVLMRSEDGRAFAPVGELALDPGLTTFRTLLPFEGRLYTSPTGRTLGWQGTVHRGARENEGLPVVFETEDPGRASWRAVSEPGFGDPDNLTVFEMAAFDGHLYAGTLNPRGYQVWKTRPAGAPPYRWTRVVTAGAHRGPLNEAVVSMCVFAGALYVGGGIQNGGFDRARGIGPAGAELIRIHPDDTWELVVGDERTTPAGPVWPQSGFGAGFDSIFNGYFWRMEAHRGCLYLGTFNWSIMLPYLVPGRPGHEAVKLAEWLGVDHLVQFEGGCDLFRSHDGVHWAPVTTSGFGNPYNFGVRSLTGTPYGLFVGTANSFGPEVAVQTPGGWEYIRNRRGGAEVWLGRP